MLTLSIFIYIILFSTFTSRIDISVVLNSHFDFLKHRLYCSVILRNLVILFFSFFCVFPGIIKSFM